LPRGGRRLARRPRQQLRGDPRPLQPAAAARARRGEPGARELLARERRAAVGFRPHAARAAPHAEAGARGAGCGGGAVSEDRGVRAVIEPLARALADRPDEVRVVEGRQKGTKLVELYVAPGDLGKVIGRQGRTAAALRTLAATAAEKEGTTVTLEIRDA